MKIKITGYVNNGKLMGEQDLPINEAKRLIKLGVAEPMEEIPEEKKELEEKTTTLRCQRDALNEENKHLMQELKTLKSEIEALSTENTFLITEIEELKNTISSQGQNGDETLSTGDLNPYNNREQYPNIPSLKEEITKRGKELPEKQNRENLEDYLLNLDKETKE